MTWWCGTVSGLRPGELIGPQHSVEGVRCVACALPRLNLAEPLEGHEQLVLLASDRDVGRLLAGMSQGDLYQVEPVGEPVRFPGQVLNLFGVGQARVKVAYERLARMTSSQREAFLRRFTAAKAVAAGEPDPEALPVAQRRVAYDKGREAFYAAVRSSAAANVHRRAASVASLDPLGLDRAGGGA